MNVGWNGEIFFGGFIIIGGVGIGNFVEFLNIVISEN